MPPAALNGGVLVAGVRDGDVGETHGMAGPAQGGQDLLVNAVTPAHRRMITEQADLIKLGQV